MSIFHLKKNKHKGFSLVELLVVIAVIGILTAVITVNFNVSRDKAKNKALMAEFKQVELALEMYKSQYGRYPNAASTPNSCAGNSGVLDRAQSDQTGPCNGIDYIDGLVPEFMDSLPQARESANDDCAIYYYVDNNNNGSWFKLTGVRCFGGAETQSAGIQSTDELARCPLSCDMTVGVCRSNEEVYYQSFAVYSPGGECY